MKVARALGVMVATVALASPAQATLITVNFSGTADLSPFGASASSSFQGSATWDPTSAPLVPGLINFDFYPVAVNISINSVDYTSSIDLPAVIEIVNGSSLDRFSIQPAFSPFPDLGPAPDDLYLFSGSVYGPTSMFSSTALPTDLDFLSSVTRGESLFIPPFFHPFNSRAPTGVGTFVVVPPPAPPPPPVPVPEPSTILLVTSSLFGFVCRSRRNRK